MPNDNPGQVGADSLEGLGEQQARETESPGPDMGADFFAQLDKAVEPLLADANESELTDTQSQATTPEEGPASSDNSGEEGIDYKQRFGDSTREARRLKEERDALKQQVKQMEPYSPLVELMQKDGKLLNMVKEYVQHGGNVTPEQPVSVKDQLNLPEDFVFDGDEAVSDPESLSAKVLNAMVEQQAAKIAEDKVRSFEQRQSDKARTAQLERERQQFQQRNNLSDAQMQELENFAEQHTITYDDVWAIKNRQERDRNMQTHEIQERKQQQQRNAQRAQSLSDVGGGKSTVQNPNDMAVNAVLNIDREADKLFQ